MLEDACRNDEELRAVLGDSIGNPELMRKRVSSVVPISSWQYFKFEETVVVYNVFYQILLFAVMGTLGNMKNSLVLPRNVTTFYCH